MWSKLVGWFKLLWDAGEDLEKHGTAIQRLQEREQRLAQAVEYLFAQNERRDEQNQRLLEEVEKLRAELHQSLNHERELCEANVRELELKQRLQISEELRRLPPSE